MTKNVFFKQEGGCHASCKEKGDCKACCNCRGQTKLEFISALVEHDLINAGVPEAVAELCAWLSEPMFRHEYPDADLPYLIVEPDSFFSVSYQRDLGFSDYDIWVGMGYESAHSDAACKMHFEVDENTRELTWCNVSEWAADDDRWRGVVRFYDQDTCS